MSFLIRATLVIGALSYFAATRDQTEGGPHAIATPSMDALPEVWQALPPEIREKAVREAVAHVGRQFATAPTLPISGDTLAEADRKPAWRGSDLR